MSFGFKRRENDFGPPTLRFRMVGKPEAEKDSKTGAFYGPSFECVYGFRYAFKTRNLGLESDSWSMRQTAVYQKFDAKENRVVWIIIGGSSDTIDLIRKNIAQSSRGSELKPFLLHAMIIENSLGEWRLYIADLASRVHSMVRSCFWNLSKLMCAKFFAVREIRVVRH
jgi:hypothetical protein